MKSFYKNKNLKRYFPLFLLLAAYSCKKEQSGIGLDLIGGESLANSSKVEYRDLIFRTVPDDTFSVNSLSSSLLGLMNDPVFGASKASLVIQPQLIETGINLTGNVIDSTQLNLVFDLTQNVDEGNRIVSYDLNYGDPESEVIIDVFRLEEDLSDTTNYLSNYNPILGVKVGEYTGKFDLDSAKREIDGEVVTIAPRMTITLNNNFGQEILDFDETILNSNENFVKAMKGLVLIPRTVVSGDGTIIAVETFNTQSSMNLFYSDSLELVIPLGLGSNRVNFFEINHTPAIEEQKTSTGHYSKTYVQSLGGTKIRIEVPQLDSIIELQQDIVINEAKLELAVDTSLSFNGRFDQAPRLLLLTPDTLKPSKSQKLINENSVNFSQAIYNPVTGSYIFHFNRYLQQLQQTHRSTGRNEFYWFYLTVPPDQPTTPHRVIVDSDTSRGFVKLSVKYTKLN